MINVAKQTAESNLMTLSRIHRNGVKHCRSEREDGKSVFSFSLFTLNLTFLVDASKFVRLE
ncbi:hypothetical protein [Listeria monocytogenes]|uniref:hypothetical protein n=1 Tax=Listeria monocytogenes TaxID=1639 RepID=UPI00135C98F7|nr:hypothetical protein [Listeria monocytogenes]